MGKGTKRLAAGVALLLVTGASVMLWRIGPRNVIGMLRYDQRQEGALKVGDPAPDVELIALEGARPARLSTWFGGRPLVLIFGSFT